MAFVIFVPFCGRCRLRYNLRITEQSNVEDLSEVSMRNAVFLAIISSAILRAQTSPLSPEQRATFHGRMSEAVEPFHIVGNLYYVGARNIASYLINTPEGHIMIATRTKELHDVLHSNLVLLVYNLQ